MNKIHIVTLSRLNRALKKVQKELMIHGFWDDGMAQIEVILTPVSLTAYGFQDFGDTSAILIPAVALPKFRDWFANKYMSLADVIRHEYGHGFSDTHYNLINNHRFEDAFWAHPSDDTPVAYDPEIHPTPYASVNAAEDFAETFALFLKHGGRLPNRLDTKYIRAKWTFVKSLSMRKRRKK
jgi:hypothetical protein